MKETLSHGQTDLHEEAEANPNEETPSVTFQSLTFSDETTINLDPADIVVFVGPNNAGKSAALRELETEFVRNRKSTVLHSFQTLKLGTKEAFEKFVIRHAQIRPSGRSLSYSGYKWSISERNLNLQNYWPDNLSSFRGMFCLSMRTEERIRGSNPPNAINTREQPAEHPIHILVSDDELENKISNYFFRAFGEDLILDRNLAQTIGLRVGPRPVPDRESEEDRVSKSYLDKVYDSTTSLNGQGDGMRSFASVILHLLAPVTASVLLLDEPEAFLHPPQAQLLGKIIATEKSSRAQLFIATHSPDVLQGLVNVASDRLKLVRMQRQGNINRIKELDKELVRIISSDPLMHYSSVLSGVFHERVIVCESDGDCMFYRSILDLPKVHGESHPDVLFVQAGGKSRMARLAETLRALDVSVEIIADMDVLRDENDLKQIINALGGDWASIKPEARIVRLAINNSKPGLTLNQIKEEIQTELTKELPDNEASERLQSNIKAIFRRASPWDAVKQNGESAIPQGDAIQRFRKLQLLCQKAGLWIVPVGEMEGFCRSIGGHGPNWVQQVIEHRDLADDPELETARNFVHALWSSR